MWRPWGMEREVEGRLDGWPYCEGRMVVGTVVGLGQQQQQDTRHQRTPYQRLLPAHPGHPRPLHHSKSCTLLPSARLLRCLLLPGHVIMMTLWLLSLAENWVLVQQMRCQQRTLHSVGNDHLCTCWVDCARLPDRSLSRGNLRHLHPRSCSYFFVH